MAETTLNMQLLLRRDNVFTSTYVLAAGEPGFEISTNILKIGDGVKTWAELDFANEAQIAALIKVTDDKVVALTEAVNKLDDTYATDAQVEAVRSALDAAKLDKETYNTYIATHAMTDEQINTAIGNIDAKFASYRTAADQDAIDETFATKAALKTVTDELAGYGDIVKHNASEFATAAQGAKADAAAVKADVDTAIENITKADGLIATAKSEAIAAAKTETETQVNALANGAVKTNTDAISAINDEETGILANAKAYVDEEDKFYNGITTVNALGGIGANTSLDGKTTHEILDALLFPYVAPSISSVSRSESAKTLENGAEQTLSSCSITIAKKSKAITKVTLYNGSTAIETKEGDSVANGGTITFNGFDAITVTKSNNPNLKFVVSDTEKTNAAERSVGASTFVYPYYWGACAADATIDEALIEGLTKNVSSKGNKTDIAFTCANQKIVFAYPKAHGVLKSIIDPNNFETFDGYARSEVSITGLDGTAQAYYVYVQKDACTVTDFKVDFKY